jgi:hypothetical protein
MQSSGANSKEMIGQDSSSAALRAVQSALGLPQSLQPAPEPQQGRSGKPTDVAAVMRLASEAIATAAQAAESELRRVRELLNQSEVRVRAAEERARVAEEQVVEWEKLLAEIHAQILAQYPQQLAA